MPKSQLLELYAHGLGVIEDARLEFGAGFNVITGETGAGKTLLLGALDLCLGGDGSVTRAAIASDMRAAAVFDLSGEREIVLTRESGASGRLRSAVDGASSSAEALRSFAEGLIVIHGQHESLTLRSRAEVLRLIDAKGDVSTQSLSEARRALQAAHDERTSLGGDVDERARELDFVEFQIAELTAVSIRSANELEETLEELTRLTELRDGQAALVEVLDQLDADGEVAVLAQFARAISRLPVGDAYDVARDALRSALEQSRDAVHELASLSDPESFDASALKELDDRATVLQALVRKYGSLADALAALDALRARQAVLVAASTRTAALDDEIEDLERSCRDPRRHGSTRARGRGRDAECRGRGPVGARRAGPRRPTLRRGRRRWFRGADSLHAESRTARRAAPGPRQRGRVEPSVVGPLARIGPRGRRGGL